MTQLQNDPIRVIPKRAFLLGLVATVVIVIISFFMKWSLLEMLGGFWIGLIANLITFRLIVVGTKNFLDRKEKGMKASMIPNLVLRMLLLTAAMYGTLQLGLNAFFAAFIGISMVRIAIQSDGFFSIGYEKQQMKKNEK